MPGPPWGKDSAEDERVIAENVGRLLTELARDAAGPGAARARQRPTIALARRWHERIYAGVSSVPRAGYLGTFRGAIDDLVDYEVVLADSAGHISAKGVPASEVAEQLAQFERALVEAVRALDTAIVAGSKPRSTEELYAVVELAALVHGEWIRIHPFANGNGRTARTWANWVALRYGLPPFVRIKPRPDGQFYAYAAHLSMGTGGTAPSHELTVQVFLDMLRSAP